MKNVKTDYGAVGDGSTNDTTAVNNALGATGELIFFPKGTYKVTSNLNEPACAGIYGEGPKDSIILADTGVTKLLKLSGTTAAAHFRTIREIQLKGNATTNAIGLVVGDGSMYAGLQTENLYINDFTGTGAIGLYVRDAVNCQYYSTWIDGNYENVRLETGSVQGTPTTQNFIGGGFLGADTVGMKVLDANGCRFKYIQFDGNTHQGVKVIPASGHNVIDLVIEDCWFELNYDGDYSKEHLLIDGTDGTPRVHTVRGYWAGGPKSMRWKGSNTRGRISQPSLPNDTGTVVVENDAIVEYDWFYSQDIAKLSDTVAWPSSSNGSVWKDWTPTLTFDTPGNLSVTYSARIGRILRMGNTMIVKFAVTTSGFTHTTASGNLKLTGLPAIVAKNTTNYVQTGSMRFQGFSAGGYADVCPILIPNESDIKFQYSGPGINIGPITVTEVPTGGTVILSGTLVYEF
jgi:hypothetical protein